MTEAKEPPKPRRVRGEGGITQRPNGLYVADVELPRHPETGKRRRGKVTSMVKSEVVSKLNALKNDLVTRGDLPTGSETVSKWMAYWMDRINKSQPSTRQGYRSSIKYIDAAIGKIKLAALTPSDVRKVEQFIVDRKGLSPTTARQAYQVLSKALKDAEREGRVFRNVARQIDPPRKAVPKLSVLTADEGIDLIGTQVEKRLGSRIAAAILTGARQGELLGLEIERVYFHPDPEANLDTIDLSWQLQRINWLHGCDDSCGRTRGTDCPKRTIDAPADWEHRPITGALYWSRPKSKAGWRVIPLVEPLRSIIRRRIDVAATEPNPYGLVWTSDQKRSKGGIGSEHKLLPLDGSPIDPSRDNKAWHQALHDAGVTQVRLHDARHTTVTILYDLGVPETTIQDIVGQSTISVTRGYRSKSRRLPAEALAMLGGLFVERLNETPAERAIRIARAPTPAITQ